MSRWSHGFRSQWSVRRAHPLRCIAVCVAAASVLLIAAFAGGAGTRLSFVEAALLGAVEGLTEFLPISSTGHLTVAARLLAIDGDAADSYVIAVQLGAIAAVAVLYRERISQMVSGVRGGHRGGRRLAAGLGVAFLPAATVGILLGEVIKDRLFGVGPVAAAWAVGGVAMLATARRQAADGAALESLRWTSAFVIGMAQVAALWPGTSRSLVTILAGLAIGLSVAAAVEFSFLLGLVTLGAASGYEAFVNGSEIVDQFGVVMPAAGVVLAFLTATISVRWMVRFLERHSLAVFGVYRLGAAAAVALLLWTGIL